MSKSNGLKIYDGCNNKSVSLVIKGVDIIGATVSCDRSAEEGNVFTASPADIHWRDRQLYPQRRLGEGIAPNDIYLAYTTPEAAQGHARQTVASVACAGCQLFNV